MLFLPIFLMKPLLPPPTVYFAALKCISKFIQISLVYIFFSLKIFCWCYFAPHRDSGSAFFWNPWHFGFCIQKFLLSIHRYSRQVWLTVFSSMDSYSHPLASIFLRPAISGWSPIIKLLTLSTPLQCLICTVLRSSLTADGALPSAFVSARLLQLR